MEENRSGEISYTNLEFKLRDRENSRKTSDYLVLWPRITTGLAKVKIRILATRVSGLLLGTV